MPGPRGPPWKLGVKMMHHIELFPSFNNRTSSPASCETYLLHLRLKTSDVIRFQKDLCVEGLSIQSGILHITDGECDRCLHDAVRNIFPSSFSPHQPL